MDYEDLILLIDRMDQSTLSYLEYQKDANQVILAKEMPQLNTQTMPNDPVSRIETNDSIAESEVKEIRQIEQQDETDSKEAEADGETVKSPMIGVAYLQANPDEDVYVNVGDRVEQGDTVCIIEAMKIMNEIQAPVSGIVSEILIENEEVVEFNQPLIRIKS